MGFGRYRFRRSFGQVGSQFRGARPDTYPLLSYVKDGLALAYEALSSLIISDKSGNGNDATLYTGRYFSTDGSTDRGIVADCSAAGSGSYYLTGKIKPSGTTQAKATINGSALNLSGLTADVWQDFTTTTKTSVTPDTVAVGWNGGGNYSAADWSDVRLIDASDDSVVGRWQGSDSSAADLDGYPALDSSGNGYHGTHTGCAGGSAEGVDADVANISATLDDKMWFDGVDDYVALGSVQTLADGETWEITLVTSDASNNGRFFGQNNNDYISLRSAGNIRIESNNINYDFTIGDQFANNTPAVFKISRSGDDYTVYIDDASKGTLEILTGVTFNSMSDPNGVSPYVGILQDFKINGVLQWDGTIANGDTIGTVNGDPVTVGQKRATILQTAGRNWNRANAYETSYADDWANGIDTWTSGTGVTYAIAQTVGGRDDCVKVTPNASGGFHLLKSNSVSLLTGDFRMTAEIYIDPSNTVAQRVVIGFDSNNPANPPVADQTGWQTIEWFWTSTANSGADCQIITTTSTTSSSYTGNGTDFVAIRNFKIEEITGVTLIPESLATAGVDALGNAIDNPRVNNEVINLFGDGEYAQIPEIGTIRSLTMAVYYAGEDITYIAKDVSVIEAYAGELDHYYFGEGTTYSGGVVGTSLNLGWNIIGITFDSNSEELGGAIINATSGSLLAYESNKALTAAEHLQNYNALKGKYGL